MRKPYKFFHDPGHGWLEVPRKELRALGITSQISTYSYQNKGMVYLEEDCDFAQFAKAKGWQKWPVDLIEEVYQDPTPIRNYYPYQATEPTKLGFYQAIQR